MRLLIVDDEEGMRDGMRRVLERQGYAVETAANGADAIAKLGRASYDIALVDLKMPGADGFEVTQFINDREGDRTVVVIVSALATVEAAVEITRRGAFDFLVKPFVPADLLRVVERAGRQRRLIEERETYLSELARERNLSRQLINSLRDGVIVLNVNRKPVLMNPRAEFLLGVAFREDLELSSLGLGEEADRAVGEVLAAPEEGVERQVRIDRSQFVLEVSAIPYLRPGEAPAVIVLVADVTEQARTEHDKNRFISMVAHELTSPLAAITGYLSVVASGKLDGQPDRIRELMGRSKVRAEALLELIQDLQYLNRREAGRVTRAIQPLDLRVVLHEQLEFFRGQAERRSVALSLQGDEHAVVNADRGDLDRVFMNLISNGIKYNRDGGKLTVRLERHPDGVEVRVTDTGIGMSEAEVGSLFQEFYRAHNPRTEGITGTGLGLATVRRVLASYNGRIDVRSTPDAGTAFIVVLPSPPEHSLPPAGEPP